ncbi:hypothetical protein V2I01_20685 [Micromonospora sp. BRA006-A]|nr:hypothetical protein [Micromonospora sp. BRA006-A]
MSRTVSLVLLDTAGRPLGALPSFGVPGPWWQEVHSIVDTVRRRHGWRSPCCGCSTPTVPRLPAATSATWRR